MSEKLSRTPSKQTNKQTCKINDVNMQVNYAHMHYMLRHVIRRWGLIVSVTSNKNNYFTSCEKESLNNFKLSKNIELRKKCQLLTVACIVNS